MPPPSPHAKGGSLPEIAVLPHSGVYETIDRPRRLVFTWESPHSIDGSTVTLDLAPVDGAPG